MNTGRWQSRLAGILVATTAALYALRWVLFPGWAFHNEMWRFLIGDIAFLFLQVVLVTMLIDASIRRREAEEMRLKLNMVIGAFFSQIGTELLQRIARLDEGLAETREGLVPVATWTSADYSAAKEVVASGSTSIVLPPAEDLVGLRDFLDAEKPFVLGLLSNQALLEHQSFTDLLWAVTHLAEELLARPSLAELGAPDRAHLSVDVKRVYVLLVAEWLDYMSHLQTQYPYLFSLASRTNPFDTKASVTITE